MEIHGNKNDFLNELLAELRDLMGVSLGIKGHGILLHQKSPKQLSITKSGQEIMKIYSDSHPFGKIIVNYIQAMTDLTGEGAKRTLLVATEFLQLLDDRLNATGSIHQRAPVIGQLEKVKRILEDRTVFQNTAMIVKRKVSSVDVLLDKFCIILGCCLRTRFNRSISDTLLEVLISFIEKSTQDCSSLKDFVEIIEKISRSFPKYVTEVYNMPVSDSRVEEGLLLGNPMIGAGRSGKMLGKNDGKEVRFVVLADEEFYDSDYTIQVNEGCADLLTGISRTGWNRSKGITEELKNHDVQLVISPKELPAVVKQGLRQGGIALVEYADREELKDLCEESGMVVWCLGDQLGGVNVGVAEGVEAVQLGSQLGTKVGVKGARCQLVLSAPQKNLVGQYSQAAWGAVKAAKQLWAGETVEKMMQDDELMMQDGKWSVDQGKMVLNDVYESSSITIRWVEGPAGFSVCFTDWIERFVKEEKECCDVIQCLGDSFQAVVRQLMINQEGKCWTTGKLTGLTHLKKNLVNQSEPVLEPVEVGMAMVRCALDIARVILKIERICPSRVRIKSIINAKNTIGANHEELDSD